MKFIDRKTDGGAVKEKIAFYCDTLDVTRQGFYWYLKHWDDPWKYESLAEKYVLSWQRMNATTLTATVGCTSVKAEIPG